MPIQVNPVSTAGLAGLSGRSTPYLNLPLYGIQSAGYGQNMLQGAVQGADLQQRYAALQAQQQMAAYQEQQANARNYLNNQTQLQTNQNTNQNQLQMANDRNAIQQQQVNQQGQYQQGQLGLQQQQLQQQGQFHQDNMGVQQQQIGIQQQQVDQQGQMMKLKAMQMMKEQELNQIGAASTIGLLGLNQNINNPQALQNFKDSWIQQQMANGTIDSNKAQQYQQMNPQQFAQELMQNTIYSSMATTNRGSSAAVGMLPQLGNVYGNLSQGKTATDAAQKAVDNTGRSVVDILPPLQNFNPDLFTKFGQWSNEIGTSYENAPNWMKNVYDAAQSIDPTGTLPSSSDAVKLSAAKSAFQSNILQSIMSTLGQQPGSRFNKMSVDVLQPEIPEIGTDSDVTAFSKMVTLQQRMMRARDYESNMLTQGVDPNSAQFANNLMNNWKQPVPGKISYQDPTSGNIYDLDYSDIKNFAANPKNGMNVQQATNFFLQHDMNIQSKQSPEQSDRNSNTMIQNIPQQNTSSPTYLTSSGQ